MKELIAVSLGELILKGKNRKYFEDKLISSMRRALDGIEIINIHKEIGKTYIEANREDFEAIVKRLKHVFGIVYISPVVQVEKNLEDIGRGIDLMLKEKKLEGKWSFKIIGSRADKNFYLTSPEINKKLGGYVLSNYPDSYVDVHNPEVTIYVDVKNEAYVYTDKIKALGGMPMGTNGTGLLLLSGGIDSPVAGFMMARRGLKINAIHFHSYPYTSERSERKVIDLANIISRYTGKMNLFSVNILEIQRAIAEHCDERHMTIISRKFMVRLADAVSQKYKYDALITGDNLGQVASQTIEGLKITNGTTDMLIFRPLIGMDKQDIVNISIDIETYETSILPYDDCCTIFAPKHPILNPTDEIIDASEAKLDIDGLVERAIEGMKIIKID